MGGRRTAAVVAAVVMVLGVAVIQHAVEISDITRVSHDDTISYLAATGHQGQYQRVIDTGAAPVAQWVPAERWQAFTQIEDRLPLLTIARDLGHHDIHPPVYFWLLHVWALLVGVQLWTGPALNVVLHVVTAVVLWRLARRLTGSPLAGWGAVGVWAVLPAVAQTATATRQYSMAGLWSITLGALFVRTRGTTSRRGLLAVAAVTALGLLTLYPFGVVVAGLGAVCVADLRVPARRRSALAQLGALVAGGVVFLLCQPWLREALNRQQEQVERFSTALMWRRVGVVLRDLPGFAITDPPAVAVGVGLLIGTALLAVLAWRARPEARPEIWLAVWIPVVLSAAYIAVLSPGAASQARYFAIALPHVALLPVLAWPALRAPVLRIPVSRVPVLRARQRHDDDGGAPATAAAARQVRPALVIAAAVFVVAVGANLVRAVDAAGTSPPARLDAGRPVVVDNLARGVLLRIMWDAPPSLPVYAADQQTLMETTDRWLRCAVPSPCNGRPLTLATQVQYDATRAGQEEILAAAADVRDVTPEPALDDLAERYRLSAPTGAIAAGTSSDFGASQVGGPSRTASTMIPMSTAARRPAATAKASYEADGVNAARRASHQNSSQ